MNFVILLSFLAISEAIIHGKEVTSDEIPFVTGILFHRIVVKDDFCGGSLISENYVLTAASCLLKQIASSVILGAAFTSTPEEFIPVEEMIPHEEYDNKKKENDIGLVKLSRPAKLSPQIQIVRLPARSHTWESFKGDLVTSAGWGSRGKLLESTPLLQLRAVNHTVISNTLCRTYFIRIREEDICVSSSTGTPCSGDEGGPIFIKEFDGQITLIGIYTYQFSLGCQLGYPAVGTRVSRYLRWIEDHSDVVIRIN